MPPPTNIFSEPGVDHVKTRIRALSSASSTTSTKPGSSARPTSTARTNGKDNKSFGRLSLAEWNTLFAKHLDHHLTQFGV